MKKLEKIQKLIGLGLSNEQILEQVDTKEFYVKSTRTKLAKVAAAEKDKEPKEKVDVKKCDKCDKPCEDCKCEDCCKPEAEEPDKDKDEEPDISGDETTVPGTEVPEAPKPPAESINPRYNRIELAITELRAREKQFPKTKPLTNAIEQWVACDKTGTIPRGLRQKVEGQYNRILPRPTATGVWRLAYIAFSEFKKISK